MEDASIIALTINGLVDAKQRVQAIAELDAAAVRISALIQAVKAMAR